ncbi:MAG TPA: pyridoxamine 5'-phosphate oxidase family protein [Candidatus Dormibacteraeota bacterium]|jgi:PPOX class probable F420-dependent enzyme
MPRLEISPEVDEFIRQPNGAVIATMRPDGFPMTVVTWYDWQDGRVLVNMNEIRARLAWMRLNPKVSLTFFDAGWSRHVSLTGLVVEIYDDTDLADIDRLARRYSGHPFPDRTGRRVSAWIEPQHVHVWELDVPHDGPAR